MALRKVSHTILFSLQQPNSVRTYSRWINRNPAKVILPFEQAKTKVDLKKEKVIELGEDFIKSQPKKIVATTTTSPIKENEEPSETPSATKLSKTAAIKKRKEEKLKKRKFYLSQKKVFDDNNEIMYEKLNENDSRISPLLVKLKSKKERSRCGMILVEGWRMIVDGLEAGCSLKYLLFSRPEDLNHVRLFLPRTGIQLYKMPYKEIELWSDTETSPGLLGIFETPNPENIKTCGKPLPLQMICDNIRVPGNLGALFRVAVGAGCEKVLLTKGCVDVWEPKVLRSAAGAHFRLPIFHSIEWDDMNKHLNDNTTIFIADSNTVVQDSSKNENMSSGEIQQIPVMPYYDIDYGALEHITLIVGGETEGISKDSYSLAAAKNGLRINIPLQKGIDSLNTGMAAAVIAFEVKKQLIQAWNKARFERFNTP